MELRQLNYFLKAAETLNFSQASRELFVTQGTLSQQISKLEQEIGQQLFVRNSRTVFLTEAGQVLQTYAQATINSMNDCLQRMSDLNDMLMGELNIGVTFSFSSIATEAILAFLKKYPKVKLNIYYKTMEELMDMLKRRSLDFVLAFKPSVVDEHIESRMLFSNYLAAVVDEHHPVAEMKSITLQELQRYSLVLPSHGLQARNVLDKILLDKDIKLNVCVEMNNVNQLLSIVKGSNYISVLSESTIIHETGLKAVRIDCKDNNLEGCIHFLHDAYTKKSVQEFVHILSDSNSILNLYSLQLILNE